VLGTRSFPIEQGIGEAINFHEGSDPSASRSAFLPEELLGDAGEGDAGVKLHTSLDAKFPARSAG
jgi:hypothetical protein